MSYLSGFKEREKAVVPSINVEEGSWSQLVQKANIQHKESCQGSNLRFYICNLGHLPARTMVRCISCGEEALISCFEEGDRLLTKICRSLAEDKDRWERDRRGDIWRNQGRQGHAPSCNIKKRLDLEVVSKVAVAWSVRTTLRCSGCRGVFVSWD